MIITVDSNVLLSIFTKDTLYSRASELMEKYSSHEFIINDCIYFELGVNFPDIETLDVSLDILEVSVLKARALNYASVLDAWTQYLRKKRFLCPSCKETIILVCPRCTHTLSFRQRILTDFIIGGFAMENSDGIMTLDYSYYRNYFPQLRVLD
ncbi:MAG: hypothetical protein SVY10_07510 [Thermodesulfobacteriota bacterium]|nr:hypothetical protein [Thermodesulfobacteriota bacterium]